MAKTDETETETERQYSLRLPPDAPARADALVPLLRRSEHYGAFRMERTTVFKIALVRGLAVLEREIEERRTKDALDERRRLVLELTRPEGSRVTEPLGDDYTAAVLTLLRRWEARPDNQDPNLRERVRQVVELLLEGDAPDPSLDAHRLAAAFEGVSQSRKPSAP